MSKTWILWLDDATRARRRWVILLHAHVPMLRLVAIVAALSQAHGRRSDRGRLPQRVLSVNTSYEPPSNMTTDARRQRVAHKP